MSEHTEGPWEVCTEPKNAFWHKGITIGTVGELSQRVCDLAPLSPNQEANGHLIAAAPDLLAALKDAREALNAAKVIPLVKQLDTAIAKAEGRLPSGD